MSGCVSGSVSVSVYILCVRVCACDMAAAYSHFKMASIFLSQQNGDCKIVVLALFPSPSLSPSLQYSRTYSRSDSHTSQS